MKALLQIAGVLSIFLGLAHATFPKRFQWSTDLASTSLLTRQIFYVHTFFIGVILVLFGVLSVSSATDLFQTPLGKRVSLGIGCFWLLRLLIQWFGFSRSLWNGKAFETAVHYLFTLLWIFFVFVYFQAATGKAGD